MDKNFWLGRRVFITGHTGFKGSWLCIWLSYLGAKVTGYGLQPPTEPSLFKLCNVDSMIHSIIADVRERKALFNAVLQANPEIVIHMAAQPLVRDSYRYPVETFGINVMGTVHLLEAVRSGVEEGVPIKSVINVTTDKCYENKEWHWGYREMDILGGYDPYSNSKACSELVTSAYRNSFFHPSEYGKHGVALATARAGNVIGGGDWAVDRLIPDCITSLLKGETIKIRNKNAIRPWQHVLEPLSGYLLLAQKLYEFGVPYGEAWNFGPKDDDTKSVEWIVKEFCKMWGSNASYVMDNGHHPHEATFLKLDCSKSHVGLGWQPKWNVNEAIDKVIEWTKAYQENRDLTSVCLSQIQEYEEKSSEED